MNIFFSYINDTCPLLSTCFLVGCLLIKHRAVSVVEEDHQYFSRRLPEILEKIMKYFRLIMVSIPLCTSLALLISIIFFLRQGSCPDGNFSCGDVCVMQRFVCNGKPDCPNGEDEDPMFCIDLHGGFWDMIDSLENKTQDDTCELSNIPNMCECRSSSVLICKYSNLTDIPEQINGDINEIIFMNTQIKLTDDSFKNYNLSLINLGNNSLQTLPSNLFKGQNKLKKLFLMENKLQTLNNSLSIELEFLKWIFLHNNHLYKLEAKKWKIKELIWLDASKNKLTLINETFGGFPSLKFLYLEKNLIEEITNDLFINLTNLIDLDLGWNRIRTIMPDAFSSMSALQDLNLKNNYIFSLEPNHFKPLGNLEKLQLGGNIDLLIGDYFFPLRSLRSLDLEDIDITNEDGSIFTKLVKLENVYFKKYKYCTIVPNVLKCQPVTDGVSSEDDLIANDLLRWILWTIAFFTLSTNALVMAKRLFSYQTTPLSLIITNLALADFLMGVYLSIIGFQDFYYKGVYRKHAYYWMKSWTCTLAGVTAMVSSEASILTLLLISAERFLLISSPLSGYNILKSKSAYSSCIAIWVFSFAIAILPVFNWRYSMRFYGKNSFCFPLHIDEPYLVGWQYSSFIFLGINSFSLLGIGLLYIGVFISIWKTRHATSLNVRDSEFAVRFTCIVMANCCCWVPIIVLKIMAFLSVEISRDVIGWIGVFVLPVNSAVNPVLYTFTTPSKTHTNSNQEFGRIRPTSVIYHVGPRRTSEEIM